MGEKINWGNFIFPRECLLSDNAQDTLKYVASLGKCDPFIQCKKRIAEECQLETQRKCLGKVIDYERETKKKCA